MIHSGHGEEVVSTISAHLTAESEVVKHGAALGVGLAAMATANEGMRAITECYSRLCQFTFI